MVGLSEVIEKRLELWDDQGLFQDSLDVTLPAQHSLKLIELNVISSLFCLQVFNQWCKQHVRVNARPFYLVKNFVFVEEATILPVERLKSFPVPRDLLVAFIFQQIKKRQLLIVLV
jgi:hypothetical protein